MCCQEPGLHPNIGRIGLHWQLFKTQTIDSFESKEASRHKSFCVD